MYQNENNINNNSKRQKVIFEYTEERNEHLIHIFLKKTTHTKNKLTNG